MIDCFCPSTDETKLLAAVLKIAKRKKTRLYLVGGYLRDMLLNRERDNPDMDFCLKKGAINFSRLLSKELKAGFVVLDREHGCGRLVKKVKDKTYTLDFTDFRRAGLENDLKHRDFTLNAFCAELGQLLKSKGKLTEIIIDPYGGLRDLKAKIIRMADKNAFREDPLRLLRAFSLSCSLNFKIDKDTLKAVKREAASLSKISGERIRDELFKILENSQAFGYLTRLDELKILKMIIPEIELMRGMKQGPYHHLDVWKHTLETLRQLELIFGELKANKQIGEYLNQEISFGRSRRSLMKLGAILHDIGKPAARRREEGKTKFHGHERIGRDITRQVVERLKLSNDELGSLEKMVLWHLRPGYLADNEEITPRAKFRYFRDSGEEALSILLISMADQRSTRGPLTSNQERKQHEKACLGLIRDYFRRQKEKKPARLANGDELIKQFKLTPSPLIGKILRELEELQAIGKIKTKKEALLAAKALLKG